MIFKADSQKRTTAASILLRSNLNKWTTIRTIRLRKSRRRRTKAPITLPNKSPFIFVKFS